jgi:probable phosphoglycerate mutase
MAVILLVRHGENEWVKKGRLAGWIPGIHLNEKGQEQVASAAARLAHLPITAIYSSPVTRCLETARPIADQFNLPIISVEAFGEVRYGKWEGKKIKKLAKKPAWHTVQHFPSRHQFPAGETLRDVQYRAVSALETLSQRHEKETIVVVSHADVIKLVLAHYLGIHLDLFQRLGLSPASISAVELTPQGTVRVNRVNDDGPLQCHQPEKEKRPIEKKPTKDEEE